MGGFQPPGSGRFRANTRDLAAVFEPEPFEEISPVVISSIRDMSNLTTVETVQYTIVEKGTDRGWLEWARGDSLQLFAVAKIGAGIDMSGISVRNVSLDDQGVVEITVPAAEIQYVSVDSEATQILDRETGLFTKGDPRLETDARQVAEEVLVQAAVDEGCLPTPRPVPVRSSPISCSGSAAATSWSNSPAEHPPSAGGSPRS